MACNCSWKCLKGGSYRKFEVFKELSWCQSFECSWGLNVLLTLGNRSCPLFPSYRRRQRLCVLMCWARACWDMSVQHIWEPCIADYMHTINKAMQRHPHTCTQTQTHGPTHTHVQSLECMQASREVDRISRHSSISLSNNWLMAAMLINDSLLVLIKHSVVFHYVCERGLYQPQQNSCKLN